MTRRRVSRRPARRLPTPRFGAVSGVWFVIAAALMLTATIIESLSLIVTSLISLVIAVVSLFVAPRTGVPGRGARVVATTKTRKPARTRVSGAKPGTTTRSTTAKTAPKRAPRGCSIACQTSVRPASSCDCACAGRNHGKRITRDQVRSRTVRRQEKEAVKHERAARKAGS